MYVILFILIIGVYGVSNIIVHGSIFDGFRKLIYKFSNFLGDLLSCMMCTSFWVGVLLILFGGFLFGIPFAWINIPILIFIGGFFSGTTWLIHTFQEYFEK